MTVLASNDSRKVEKLRSVRGMADILPDVARCWHSIQTTIYRVVDAYGYQEIHLPLVERTDLFRRTIGEVTDIVEKEMYTFIDRNGDSLTLRPEGTAGCVRAAIENGLIHNQVRRFWYSGPMFRHERPQKGRYRQFHQAGLEAFGMSGPEIDAELILICTRLWRELGVQGLQLEINSLGSHSVRAVYREHLSAYFENHAADLDEDSRRRLATNPLRILDSKNPAMEPVIANAPSFTDYLDEASQRRFDGLRSLLEAAEIEYKINPRLVRGLDYYNDTVFEWTSEQLGAQGTVCAGGCYDSLVEQLGGQATPAMGFALGIERLAEVMAAQQPDLKADRVHAYLVVVGERAQQHGILLAEYLRDHCPRVRIQCDCTGGGMKNQIRRADRSGADVALILGEDELVQGQIAVKYLRSQRAQEAVTQSQLVELLEQVASEILPREYSPE